ncbi:hypothetical protein LIER_39149 [Lithospermum erythrorhizon]|uniref:MULE transposase domain-containing protein n=1 Tax=Lithospermum erythrorhizon TaxID=34254 RepID=A0AAV3QA95_LITER
MIRSRKRLNGISEFDPLSLLRHHRHGRFASTIKLQRPAFNYSLLNLKNKPISDSPVLVEVEKVKEKLEDRLGCKAEIFLKLDESAKFYRIYKWEGAHTHKLYKAEHLRYLRSFRRVTEAQGQVVVINSKGVMLMRTSYEVMGEEVGGTENLGFRFSDLKNYLMTIHQKEMVLGEATLDYSLFGDVISFDITYRTNNQYRPLDAFLGFDNHCKSVLLGGALLYNETAPIFDWLGTTFLKCMKNKKSPTIYTDQATALLKSIHNVFEGVFHDLCSWHMGENAKKNLGSRANSAFFDELHHLVSQVDDKADFEFNWNQMMSNCFNGRPTSEFRWLV